MDSKDNQFQQKFQQLLKLKEIYSTRNVLPQRIQRLKLVDINFQIKYIRQKQQNRLNHIINSSIISQNIPKKQQTERSYSNQLSRLNIADQQNICVSCEKYIFEKKITLLCLKKFTHNYHSSCLANIMKQQLANQCIKFQCLCKSQIIIGQISRQKILELDVFIDRLMQNQLYYIKTHYQNNYQNIKQCANKDCDFFWIYTIKQLNLLLQIATNINKITFQLSCQNLQNYLYQLLS